MVKTACEEYYLFCRLLKLKIALDAYKFQTFGYFLLCPSRVISGGKRVGTKEAAMDLKEVAKAIEKCIWAFYIFIKTDHDNDKTWWKLKNSLWSYSPVEDPRDLQLLADLNQTHRKVKVKFQILFAPTQPFLVPNTHPNNKIKILVSA